MAKLNSLFKEFLSKIEPSEDAVKYAQDAHKPVRDCLGKDDKFKDYFEGSFLYGSYRRHTAVGDIKDVDIVVLTNFDPEDPENSPQNVLRKLKGALARCYNDPENPQYQRRSIRIDDPLPHEPQATMTLDIIPAFAVEGEESALLVPDREAREWVKSHPKAHLAATSDLNKQEVSEEKFVPLVKIMKWWWKHQSAERLPDVVRPKPKGFWLELLTVNHFDRSQHEYADHFIAVLESVSQSYTGAHTIPELPDPGLPSETIKTSMTINEFSLFMRTVNESLQLSYKARDESDQVKSSEMWQEIFGGKFPLYDDEETQESRRLAAAVTLGDTSHIEKLRWPLAHNLRYKVTIQAHTYSKGGKRLGGLNSNGRSLCNGINIKYEARTKVPEPYEVYWQVVNTGKHAEQENALRGRFFKAKQLNGERSSNPLVNWEITKYTGKHWIQCFIIKEGICVAKSEMFYVIVRNPAFA